MTLEPPTDLGEVEDISSTDPCLSQKLHSGYSRCGIVLLRSAIPNYQITKALNSFREYYSRTSLSRRIDKYNAAEYRSDEALPSDIEALSESQPLLDILELLIGPDIGLYGRKLLLKDKYSNKRIHLHQDSSYQVGLPKHTCFFAITHCSPVNGMIIFLPGTHSFGYLGDCGEIDRSILSNTWPEYQPSLYPGDVIIMNPHLWHYSQTVDIKSPRCLYTASYSNSKCLTGTSKNPNRS